MNVFSRNSYIQAISKKEINDWINSSNTVNSIATAKIQATKELIVSKISSAISNKIDSKDYIEQEKTYIDVIEAIEWINIWNKDELIKSKKQELEATTKRQSPDYFLWDILKKYESLRKNESINKFRNIPYHLASKQEWFKEYTHFLNLEKKVSILNWYNASFEKYKDYPNKYAWLSKFETIWSASAKDEKNDINYYLDIISNDNEKKNTRSKELWFDINVFNNSQEENHKNIRCFYENDFAWNKRYFSINELLNDLETFWIESGIPSINQDSIPSNIRNQFFPSINRRIRHISYSKIISEMRDKQEILLYWFKDYELISWEKNDKKEWFLAEKIVEWIFRNMANYSWYNIQVKKASIWEDQNNKIDLIISLEDKKTWINIEKQLQLTIKDDTSIKEKQIEKRKIELKNLNREFTDIELIKLTLWDLWKKTKVWQHFNRPIWWIKDLLSGNELELLQVTFDRISSELENKKTR